MARNRKRRTTIQSFSERDIEEVVRLAVQDGWSVREEKKILAHQS
jgi:hypothetical protein